MGKIFVSYRREDTADATGRICDRLMERFGETAVFKDVDSIPIGADFRKVLQRAVEDADVVLVVIGRQWVSATGAQGLRRLDDPHDFVRFEIEAALARDVPVVPVLVQNATMPHASELPASLGEFAYRHGIDIRSDAHFRADVEQMIEQLAPMVAAGGQRGTTSATTQETTPAPAATPAPQADASPPENTRIVDVTGRGQYRTIEDAVNAAAAGDRIVIRPGNYTVGMVTGKALEYVGESAENTFIEGKPGLFDTAACLIFDVGTSTLRNLSFMFPKTPLFSSSCSTLWARSGTVIVEDCSIATQGSAHGIDITGGAVIARRTRIHNCGGHGIQVTSGSLTLEACELSYNGKSGVSVASGKATARGSRIVHNREWGVNASASVEEMVIEECDVRGNVKGAWNIQTSKVRRERNQE